jgi:hypothetical protein
LPGKRITQHQESLYMSKRQQGKSQETAAAKAAISERSGRRIEKGERHSVPGERCWRRLKTDHPYRLKIDQGKLLYSVLYSIEIVDQTELVLNPFFY